MAKYPIISNVKITPTNPPEFEGLYVQSVTEIDVTVDIDFGPNPKKKRCVIAYCIPNYNLSYFEEKMSARFRIPKYINSPQHQVRVTVDNGISKSNKIIDIETISYTAPRLIIDNERYGSDSVKVTLSGEVDSVGGRNTRTLKLRWRDVKSQSYFAKNIPLNSWQFEEVTYISGIPADQSLEIIGELSDAAKTETAYSQNGTVLMSRLAGGKGITFFEEARKEGFWIRNFNLDVPQATIKALNSNYLADILVETRGLANSASNLAVDLKNNIQSLSQKIDSVGNEVTAKEVKAISGGSGASGNLTLFPAFRIAFVRIYHNNTQKWAKGSTHNLLTLPVGNRPPSHTALACHCVTPMSARVGADGVIVAVPKEDMNKGFAIYVSGIFMY